MKPSLLEAATRAYELLQGFQGEYSERGLKIIFDLRDAIAAAEKVEPVSRRVLQDALIYRHPPLYTAPPAAIPPGWQLVPVEPIEEEIDAPRYLFQALELGIKNIQDIRKHLEMCGVDISCTPEWFRNDSGHLTKAGKAIVARALMLAAAPKPPQASEAMKG